PLASSCSPVTSMSCASRPCRWTAGTSSSSGPRASDPQSQLTISSTATSSSFFTLRRPPVSGSLSPAVPVHLDPGGDVRRTVEQLAKELLDLGIGRESLGLLGGLPDIDDKDVARLRRAEEDVVREVAGLLRHLPGGAGDCVV